MKKKQHERDILKYLFKTMRIMRLSLFFIVISSAMVFSANSYSQNTKLTLELNNITVKEALKTIEKQSEFLFFYQEKHVDLDRLVSVHVTNQNIESVLNKLFAGTDNIYVINDRQIVIGIAPRKELVKQIQSISGSVKSITEQPQRKEITGKVADESGFPLPGVSIIVKGTTIGTVTNSDGEFSISVPLDAETLQFSFVGMSTQEVQIEEKTIFNIVMEEDMIGIEEVVAIGYGTMLKGDLTGSVVKADLETFKESPSTTILESLKGIIPGLEIGQTVEAGKVPSMLIRGQSTLAGSNSPLIVIDGVIFRGNINDINPSDIESVDILKDASAAAVYGSQATNGVIILSTSKGKGISGKPIISYSGSYSFNNPVRELRPPTDIEKFHRQKEESQIFLSRTEESNYLEKNPNWEFSNIFSTNEESDAYINNRTTNWYDIVTNDNMYMHEHNLSMSNSVSNTNYLVSVGYSEQAGYMKNEGYSRLTSRINIDNYVTEWLELGVQTFMSLSDYSSAMPTPSDRFIEPYATDTDGDGKRYRTIIAGVVNPFLKMESNDFNQNLQLFGNIYSDIDLSFFIKGLSYRINFANNYQRSRHYRYREYAVDFLGQGDKEISFRHDWSADNILTYKRKFDDIHNVLFTFVYGLEKAQSDITTAIGQNFINDVLIYNNLQASDSQMQRVGSGAWEESSLYSMSRLFYGYKNKYLITGTIRRDGFSGFTEKNKFGVFPSISIAWNLAEESFFNKHLTRFDQLKIRASYGTVGNRTIGRYQTLARVEGEFGYIDMSRNPLYVQNITSLESPNLKWEKTTGINLGIDFALLSQRIMSSIEYYNNNTTDLFYNVDIPAIGRYTKFPDNLGKLNNQGIELSITTINIKNNKIEWGTTFNFFRNRNKLKELLGFDLDGDGKEDDLISQGLFIGKSINAIYDYEIDGKWQLNDNIPAGYDVGAHKPVDQNGDGIITPENDRKIIGYTTPSYTIGINNSIHYKNWNLKFFIHTIQGGEKYFLGPDNYLAFQIQNSEMHLRRIFPEDVDYWTPENPNARYQRPDIYTASGYRGNLYGDRSFIRLQNISLSYNLSNNFLKDLGLYNVRLFLNGKNLLTLTKWNGWDPETNQTITMDGRPVIKSCTIGLNVEF